MEIRKENLLIKKNLIIIIKNKQLIYLLFNFKIISFINQIKKFNYL